MKRRRQGFVTIMVLAVLSLMGAVLIVLADISSTMVLESNRAFVQAHRRNLTASGLAWLKHNNAAAKEELARGVDLDMKDLRQGGVRVAVTTDGQYQITTDCRQGPVVEKRQETFSADTP